MASLFDRLKCPRCGTAPLAVARVRVGEMPALAFDCFGCGHESVVTLAQYLAMETEAATA